MRISPELTSNPSEIGISRPLHSLKSEKRQRSIASSHVAFLTLHLHQKFCPSPLLLAAANEHSRETLSSSRAPATAARHSPLATDRGRRADVPVADACSGTAWRRGERSLLLALNMDLATAGATDTVAAAAAGNSRHLLLLVRATDAAATLADLCESLLAGDGRRDKIPSGVKGTGGCDGRIAATAVVVAGRGRPRRERAWLLRR